MFRMWGNCSYYFHFYCKLLPELRSGYARGDGMTRAEAIFVLERVKAYGAANDARKMAIEALKVESKHGRWITVSDGYGNGVATASICECSLCKDTIWVYKNDKRKWNYCPNCGASMMDEVENGK